MVEERLLDTVDLPTLLTGAKIDSRHWESTFVMCAAHHSVLPPKQWKLFLGADLPTIPLFSPSFRSVALRCFLCEMVSEMSSVTPPSLPPPPPQGCITVMSCWCLMLSYWFLPAVVGSVVCDILDVKMSFSSVVASARLCFYLWPIFLWPKYKQCLCWGIVLWVI